MPLTWRPRHRSAFFPLVGRILSDTFIIFANSTEIAKLIVFFNNLSLLDNCWSHNLLLFSNISYKLFDMLPPSSKHFRHLVERNLLHWNFIRNQCPQSGCFHSNHCNWSRYSSHHLWFSLIYFPIFLKLPLMPKKRVCTNRYKYFWYYSAPDVTLIPSFSDTSTAQNPQLYWYWLHQI